MSEKRGALNPSHEAAVRIFRRASQLLEAKEYYALRERIVADIRYLTCEGRNPLAHVAYAGMQVPAALQTPAYCEAVYSDLGRKLGEDLIPATILQQLCLATALRREGLGGQSTGKAVVVHASAFGWENAQKLGMPEDAWQELVSGAAREVAAPSSRFTLRLIAPDVEMPSMTPFSILQSLDFSRMAHTHHPLEGAAEMNSPEEAIVQWRGLLAMDGLLTPAASVEYLQEIVQ